MMNDEKIWDLVVIGGGAAGFFTAIQTAEASYGTAKILLLEKSSQLLGKVKISGGGRCNVTHSCFDPKTLSKHYPRGEKTLIGPFHHFQPSDMIQWLADQGVELKTEADGRMFPTTDDSGTIIKALCDAAQASGVKIQTKQEVTEIVEGMESRFQVITKSGDTYCTQNVMISTGGTRLKSSSLLPTKLGHQLLDPVPSLFTFNIVDPRLENISGVSVQKVKTSVRECKLDAEGPILVTHWGLSGPAILKLSAWGARLLHHQDYTFTLHVNWSPDRAIESVIKIQRQDHGKRLVHKRSVIESIPKRLWEKLVHAAHISEDATWSQLTKQQILNLTEQIHHCPFQASGKSINKDEFVTCGGVPLQEVKTKTFESKLCEGIYFSGEVLDIDGITGGFNFQNAWTTAYLASQAIAADIMEV